MLGPKVVTRHLPVSARRSLAALQSLGAVTFGMYLVAVPSVRIKLQGELCILGISQGGRKQMRNTSRSRAVAVALTAGFLAALGVQPAVQATAATAAPVPAGRNLVAAVADDSVNFTGGSAAAHLFRLDGGSYDVNIVAQYNELDDVNGYGQCLFSGYINGPHALHLTLGGPAPVVPAVPFIGSTVLLLPAGSYLLDVLINTDCAWDITVLDLGVPVYSRTGHQLLPMPIGKGMCPASKMVDGSVQAQVDLYDTSCASVQKLGPGADAVQGANFSLDGWKCRSTAEGPASAWASSWGQTTYYTYYCAGPDYGRAAFNWGRDYTYQ